MSHKGKQIKTLCKIWKKGCATCKKSLEKLGKTCLLLLLKRLYSFSLSLTLCLSFASPWCFRFWTRLFFRPLPSCLLSFCPPSSALLVLFVELRFNTAQFKDLVVSHFPTKNSCQEEIFFVTYDVRDNLVGHFFAILPPKKKLSQLHESFLNSPPPSTEGEGWEKGEYSNLHGPSLCHTWVYRPLHPSFACAKEE